MGKFDGDHSGGEGPFGSGRDELYWSIRSNRPGDMSRSKTTGANGDGDSHGSPLVVFFGTLVELSSGGKGFNLKDCSNQELRDLRDTCESIMNKISGLTWATNKTRKITHPSANPAAGAKKRAWMAVLGIIDIYCNDENELFACTNSELQEFHDTCEKMMKQRRSRF